MKSDLGHPILFTGIIRHDLLKKGFYMSIRKIAKLLYKLQKEIEALEESLDRGSTSEKDKKIERLKQLKVERDKVKAILDGMKKKPEIRIPR